MDIIIDDNLPTLGFDLDSDRWIMDNDANLTIGNATPPTSAGFSFNQNTVKSYIDNHASLSGFEQIRLEAPEVMVNGKSLTKTLESVSTLLKFIVEKYDLHECKELKELAELDQWTEKVDVEKIPDFLKDEDFNL